MDAAAATRDNRKPAEGDPRLRCELLAIGTELLLGQIVDTNSAWIGERLARIGIDCHFHVTVGDNPGRIEASLRQALDRSDAVICCGGLGPTQDDVTREAVARVMGAALERDPRIAARIRHRFESRGRAMTANNLRQADVPAGATPIAEMPGTAPGLICPVGGKVIYALPGVPHEMRDMMNGSVLRDLERRAGRRAVIRSRVLRSWGRSESGLAETLAPRIRALDDAGNPTLAFQASGIEGIKVRITAKAADDAEAAALLDAEERAVRALLGDAVFGLDDQTMESVVVDRLRALGLTLAAAETITGGVLSQRLTAADPAGETFVGATILRAAASDASIPDASIPDAAAAAQAVRTALDAGVGIAAADPAPGEAAPSGAVQLGISIGDRVVSERTALPGDRARLREYAVIGLLNLLRKTLPQDRGQG